METDDYISDEGKRGSVGAASEEHGAKKRRTVHDDDDGDDAWQINWEALANGEWGRKPLTHEMSSELLGNLVGWATHLEEEGGGASNDDQHSSSSSVCNNPLAVLPNTPLRPSLLSFIQEEMLKILIESKEQGLWESFDTSALVAIGTIFEEMLTAAFLPLAERHVERCRQLLLDDNEQEAFNEWTLPPDDAVLKLTNWVTTTTSSRSSAEPLGGMPTSWPAARTCCDTTSAPPSPKTKFDLWCRQHGSSLEAAQKAWHIFKLFLPEECEKLGLEDDDDDEAPKKNGDNQEIQSEVEKP